MRVKNFTATFVTDISHYTGQQIFVKVMPLILNL